MARLRTNFQKGTLGAALTVSGTTITFASAPGFPTVADGDVVVIVLDAPDPEIVHLTAYTAGATTGTIARGKEGTTAVAHVSGVAWRHGPIVSDLIGLITQDEFDLHSHDGAGGEAGGALKKETMGAVIHGSDPSVARPLGFPRVAWSGSVAPTAAIDHDLWDDTSDI